MARKSKKRAAQRRAARPVQAPVAPQASPERQPARTGGDQALVRAVEMSLAPRTATTGRRAQRGILIGDNDPAIPLDRVPYFTSDLAKLGIVAVLMLVLLLAGSQLIPLVVR